MHKHLEVLQWLKSQDPPCPWGESTCAGAAAQGQLEVLQWLRSQDPPFPWGKCTCAAAAAAQGQLEVLQWPRSQDPPCPWDRSTCFVAASYGQLKVLQWLTSQNPRCPWDHHVCAGAAEDGQLEVLQWLRSQDPPCPWDDQTGAASRGHLEILQWVRSVEAPCPWDSSVCRIAAAGGHLEILKWLRSQDPPSPWDPMVCVPAKSNGAMVWALLNGCPIPHHLVTLQIQLLFLICVKHKRGNMDHVALPTELPCHLLTSPREVITHIASLMQTLFASKGSVSNDALVFSTGTIALSYSARSDACRCIAIPVSRYLFFEQSEKQFHQDKRLHQIPWYACELSKECLAYLLLHVCCKSVYNDRTK